MAEKLVHYTCEICGEQLTLNEDRLSAKCKFCGTEYYFKEDNSQDLVIPLNRANEDRRRCDFYDAIKGYKSILTEYPNNAEANWGLVLSTYGIEYVQDTRTQKYIPTCHRVVEESILNHPNYIEAIKNAAPEQVKIFETKAKQIDKLQKSIKFKMEDEEEFEVFISFKSKDEKGIPTPDSVIGRRIRDELENRGIKTFFSDVTLEDRMGDEYEPIIYKALHTCKAFILIGTSKANINAPWVKNEWSRFEERIEKEHLTTGTWFAVFDKIKAGDFPSFLSTQGFDLRNYPVGYEIKIADAIALKLGKTKKEDKSAELQKQLQELQEQQRAREEEFLEQQRKLQEQMKNISSKPQGEASVATLVDPLVKRMYIFLEDGNFTDAGKYAEKVLDLEPENEDAYLGKLLIDRKVKKVEDLKDLALPFDKNDNYVKIMRYGSQNLKEQLQGYTNFIKERNELARKESVYAEALEQFKLNTKNGYKNAIEIFTSIKDFKDSTKKIQECQNGINELIYQEVEKRFENYLNYKYVGNAEGIYKKKIDCLQKDIIPYYEEIGNYKNAKERLNNANSLLTTLKQKGFLTIKDITVECGRETDITPIFSIPSQAEELEYSFSGDNVTIQNGKIIGLKPQTSTKVTAKSNNFFAEFMVTAVEESYTKSLIFKKEGNGYIVTGISDNNEIKIIIPDYYNSLPVTGISSAAFIHCCEVIGVTIGENIKEIGMTAFCNCGKLVEVFNKSSLAITKGSTAYGGVAKNAVNVYTPTKGKAGTLYYNDDLVITYTFNGEVYLVNYLGKKATITLPNSVTIINKCAFLDNKYLTEVTFGKKVKSIGESAFAGCSNLSKVIILPSVKEIGEEAFSDLNKCTINYTGTKTEWKEVVKEETWKEDSKIKLAFGEIIVSAGNTSRSAYKPYKKPFDTDSLKRILIIVAITLVAALFVGGIFGGIISCRSCNPTVNGLKLKKVDNGWAVEKLTNKNITDVVIPSTYEGKPIGYIKTSAFENCGSLKSVTIGNNIAKIGDYAFKNCGSLNSVTISDSVTTIGWRAFENCSSLSSITIPSSVTNIGNNAFGGCVAEIIWDNPTISKINSYAFEGYKGTSIEVPSSVTSIESGAFYSCKELTEIKYNATNCEDLSSGATAFGCAGQNGSGIKVTIGANVTKIPAYLFYRSNNWSSLNIKTIEFEENSVCTSIGAAAFRECSSLSSITIPERITTIGKSAFDSCTSLSQINFNATNCTDLSNDLSVFSNAGLEVGCNVLIGPNVTKIPNYMFYDSDITDLDFVVDSKCEVIGVSAFQNCQYLRTIVIPDKVKKINKYAFNNCSVLNKIEYNAINCDDLNDEVNAFKQAGERGTGCEVVVGQKVERIPAYLFCSDYFYYDTLCPKITAIIFSDNSVCHSIGDYAFFYLDSLKTVKLPNSLKSIGVQAFYRSKQPEVFLENNVGWYCTTSFLSESGINLSSTDLSNSSTLGKFLVATYASYYWKRNG